MPTYFYALLAYYAIAFSFLIATSYKKSLFKYRLLAKVATSLGFIAVGWFSGVQSGNFAFFLCLLPAFLLCFTGDILLALTGDDGKKKAFIFGLLAFLTGHILFTIGFDTIAPFKWQELILPLASGPLVLLLMQLRQMQVGRMKNYIFAYAFFVSLLFSKGISVFILNPAVFGGMVLGGSILFFISDFIILFLYFYKDKHPLTCFVNLLTYYLATFLLAFSIYFY